MTRTKYDKAVAGLVLASASAAHTAAQVTDYPGRPFPVPRLASGTPARPGHRRVIVASDYELARRSHMQRLAMATLELRIPRRRLADRIAEVNARYDCEIVWGSGAPFTFSEMQIYEDFLLVEGPGRRTDFSQRWVGDFYRFSVMPPRQLAQSRVIARLRWIDLMWRIENPERAKLIAK